MDLQIIAFNKSIEVLVNRATYTDMNIQDLYSLIRRSRIKASDGGFTPSNDSDKHYNLAHHTRAPDFTREGGFNHNSGEHNASPAQTNGTTTNTVTTRIGCSRGRVPIDRVAGLVITRTARITHSLRPEPRLG